ncbi:hypothetical protein B0H15DRAFT_799527 [Mycena belliarum]|uniref:Uncharacterized protein n=1 Tax=Mycena belliarum TaxID=1033014 RepID=A0AAD6TWC3_9AGAR|nr:hypothetical protein B0H15DRAFT_954012 [Mycena belliae]KAJ7085365.1 hypothetical protein B0H15DRAFT_801952 [Mycena belliae]KAJ7092364.1 hypothetical protein B0H15DRAFT_799527 [Mycena belliae]
MNSDDEQMSAPMDASYQAPQRVKIPMSGGENPAKKAAICGPERAALDEARDNEYYHKQQVIEARAKSRTVAQYNESLRAELATAKNALKSRQDEVQQLQVQIAESHTRIQQMNYDEGGLHEQIQYDQEQLSALLQKVSVAQGHAAEASAQTYQLQEAIQARDTELQQLRAQVHKQDDEVNHLRLQLQAAARPKAKAMARRRGRVSNELFGVAQPFTLTLPLDPAPVPTGSPAVPAVASDPIVERFAARLNMDVETLTEFLGVLNLAKGNDAQVVVNSTGGRRKSNAKAEIKKSWTPESKELANHGHKMLRVATFTKFRVEQGSDFIFHSPATERQVQDFAEDEDATLTRWQWDFNAGYLDSAWNAVLMQKIVDAAIKEDEKGMRYVSKGEIHREYLDIVLVEQLERYRGDWKLFQPRWLEDKDRAETKAEAMARGKVMLFIRRLASKTINGQKRKFLVRQTTVEAVIALKEADGASDLATWKRVLELLEYLQSEGMSEEEETPKTINGQKVKAFKILLCVWREPEVAKMMNVVDVQRRRFEEIHSGTKPAPRERGNGIGKRPAPRGLPKCLYDSAWLASQSPKQLKELKVSKDVFALFMAATERMAM